MGLDVSLYRLDGDSSIYVRSNAYLLTKSVPLSLDGMRVIPNVEDDATEIFYRRKEHQFLEWLQVEFGKIEDVDLSFIGLAKHLKQVVNKGIKKVRRNRYTGYLGDSWLSNPKWKRELLNTLSSLRGVLNQLEASTPVAVLWIT